MVDVTIAIIHQLVRCEMEGYYSLIYVPCIFQTKVFFALDTWTIREAFTF